MSEPLHERVARLAFADYPVADIPKEVVRAAYDAALAGAEAAIEGESLLSAQFDKATAAAKAARDEVVRTGLKVAPEHEPEDADDARAEEARRSARLETNFDPLPIRAGVAWNLKAQPGVLQHAIAKVPRLVVGADATSLSITSGDPHTKFEGRDRVLIRKEIGQTYATDSAVLGRVIETIEAARAAPLLVVVSPSCLPEDDEQKVVSAERLAGLAETYACAVIVPVPLTEDDEPTTAATRIGASDND